MKSTRKIRPTTLQFERLEPRQVMASSIAATLDGNVLRVEDTERDDDIVIRQHAGQVKIDGVAGSWDAGSVQLVDVRLSGGHDFVSLRRLGNIDAKITTHAGIERVSLADGRDLFFEGLGKELEITSGSVTLAGRGVRGLKQDAADNAAGKYAWIGVRNDGVLDRTEMIRLFHGVARDGKVTHSELGSMRQLVRDNSKFGDLHYVQTLSQYVVLGNRANAHFRGRRLGDLKEGSTGKHLNDLVSKWFFGSDRPTTRVKIKEDWVRFRYAQVTGHLYSNGIQYTDVRQGVLGDCYLLAALAGAANKDPDFISEMFIDNGDQTFTVRYFHGTKAQYVTVDMYLPVNEQGRLVFANSGDFASANNKELWVALAEKAYAQINESGWLRRHGNRNGQNSYYAIAGGYPRYPLAQITRLPTGQTLTNSRLATIADVIRKLRNGSIMTFGSNSKPTRSTVVGGHAYTVVAFDASRRTLTLFNPWGVSVGGKQPGLIRLTWPQLKANFFSYDYTLPA